MNVLDITSPDVNNGTGFRVTLWIAGCSRRCKGCQNPQTWNYKQGYSIKKVWNKLKPAVEKSYIQGLTISGGDPFDQSNKNLFELYLFLKKFKKYYPEKDIWIYSGDVYENLQKNWIKRKILSLCNILVDGPYNFRLRDTSLPFRGSSNQRIIDLRENNHTKN